MATVNRINDRLAGLSIGFIGAGRLGTALAMAFEHAGLSVTAAASANPASAERMAARLQQCEAVRPQQVADRCDLVFVTTPDAAIQPTATAMHWRAGTAVVHCSGATEVDTALARPHACGAAVGGFHPMQTFADPGAAARSLRGCTVTIEAADPSLDALLVAIAARLGCPVNRLPAGMRARYHAAAGYGSQFINVLFAEAARVFASWGATEDETVRALLPMARGTLAAIETAGIGRGMPGPVSRGDVETVGKHVAAMAGLDDSMALQSYRLMCARTVELARASAKIDDTIALRFQALLDALPDARSGSSPSLPVSQPLPTSSGRSPSGQGLRDGVREPARLDSRIGNSVPGWQSPESPRSGHTDKERA